jgi:hypothetical protein
MSTAAQQEASRANALHSTGPRTEEGKAASSRNHTKLGLFTRRDHVLPHETELYQAFRDALLEDLAPSAPLEQSLAAEIVSAQWRLRRCAEADADTDNAMPADSTERARTRAINIVTRLMRELRQLQTNRQVRAELVQPDDPAARNRGLADERHLVNTWTADDRHRNAHLQMVRRTPITAASASNCTPRNSAPQVARNTPCPCGSGQKYKRCCGKSAPPVLH